MLVKRKVKNSRIIVLGRVYLFPEHTRKEIEGKEVFVDDDGVVRTDKLEWGVRTTSRVCVKYPGRYDYFTYATLDEKGIT
jgi:hypothetical protein